MPTNTLFVPTLTSAPDCEATLQAFNLKDVGQLSDDEKAIFSISRVMILDVRCLAGTI